MILDSPIISGSLTQQAGQTAEIPRYTAVSSSFLAASASFDARIDSIESTTASLSPRINALESFTASANGTYVNASGDSMSGDLIITGSLIVTDRITAQEFHTEYVSSSIVFQSGSTKFGDSGDDVHSFTGSLKVDGNVIASNLNGIFSSSAQLTSSLGDFFIISGTITQTTWDNIASKPGGIVSGSSQVVSLLPTGVVSGSSQITYSSISSIPAGIVSGAMQVTESLDVRYRLVGDDITFAELTFKPTLISGSSQLNGTTIQNLSGSFSGSFSGSYRGDGSGLTGLAAGAKFHTQSTPSATWTFIHNLSTQYPNVTVYGSNDTIILPQSITATNANTLVLEFGTPVAGYATAGIGGTIEVNGRTIKQYFTSSLSWRFEHNIGDRFVSIQTFDGSYEKIIPQTIALTDTTSSVITFPEAIAGWAVGTIGGDLPSISSSYGGYVLQVSAGAPYTASWTAVANVTASNAVNALTASHLNPISQSLIPAVSGAYDLGSVSNPWKHIYVGTGSIYLVDNAGTIVKTLTGDSIVTNDNLSSLNAFTASNFTTNTFTSSATARLNSIETITSSNIARLNSIETISASNIARIGSIETITSSNIARLNSIETISASNIARINALETTSASVDTLNTTQNTRLSNLEIKTGSLASTGSNTFIGTQTITGSLFISANLVVQGTSSLENITASAVSIGTNIVNLNTANPAIRYAGLVIGDSGSVGSSGSFLYDSVQDEFIFVHRGANTTVTSSVLLMGPQTYDSIGNETYLTTNRIPKGAGNEHLIDSNISDNGTLITINSTTASFTGVVGIGTTNPGSKLTIRGTDSTSMLYLGISGSSSNGEAVGITFGSATYDKARIIAYNENAGNAAGYLTFWTGGTPTTTDVSEKVRISSAGYIGIGTTSPGDKLHVYASGYDANIRLTDAGVANADWSLLPSSGTTTAIFRLYNRATATTCTTWTTDGKVGIGTTSPGYKLDVLGPTGSTSSMRISATYGGGNLGMLHITSDGAEGGGITFEKTSATAQKWKFGCGSTGALFFYNETGGSQPFTISTNGNVGLGVTNPSKTLTVAGRMSTSAIVSGNLIAGNIYTNISTAPSYILICDLNNAAGFSMSGKVNAASYTCWNISDIWIKKDYSSITAAAGITGAYKSGCDFSIVDISYGAGRYIALRFTSNPEIDVMFTGYRLNELYQSDGTAMVVTSGVTVNGTYASY